MKKLIGITQKKMLEFLSQGPMSPKELCEAFQADQAHRRMTVKTMAQALQGRGLITIIAPKRKGQRNFIHTKVQLTPEGDAYVRIKKATPPDSTTPPTQ